MPENPTYCHGHHESVLRSHSWRTAQNSAAYLLKHLQPTMHILDIGCGPGTITASLARLVLQGHVTGIDYAPADSDLLAKARQHAAEQGLTNITFAHGDICNLEGIPDDTYDVVHCHQVLQHVVDPVQGLREMRRVAKPGGRVAAREADSGTFAWYPETEGMAAWIGLYRETARANRTEPDAGRRLVAWALEAGFEREAIDATTGTWCFSAPEERAWFGGMWAGRIVGSTFATHAVEKGLADREELERMAAHWRAWAAREDGWFAMLHGEIVCRV
ncbi:S-adenosyl-L-methionine-dependent methyltransferase [Boletus coccyginus]|nr:S-adenosyl-L-methionine-dependent methyltransferase [Boletus coccyginus]